MYYVYLLVLKDKSIYTGSTKDVKKRFEKHRKGSVLATKGKRPFEKYLKNGSGQAFRNKHLI